MLVDIYLFGSALGHFRSSTLEGGLVGDFSRTVEKEEGSQGSYRGAEGP